MLLCESLAAALTSPADQKAFGKILGRFQNRGVRAAGVDIEAAPPAGRTERSIHGPWKLYVAVPRGVGRGWLGNECCQGSALVYQRHKRARPPRRSNGKADPKFDYSSFLP
jgi:hypothetical protein